MLRLQQSIKQKTIIRNTPIRTVNLYLKWVLLGCADYYNRHCAYPVIGPFLGTGYIQGLNTTKHKERISTIRIMPCYSA